MAKLKENGRNNRMTKKNTKKKNTKALNTKAQKRKTAACAHNERRASQRTTCVRKSLNSNCFLSNGRAFRMDDVPSNARVV